MPRPSLRPRRASASRQDDQTTSGLTAFDRPFANPGALRMLAFVPNDLPSPAPLVVVLHGCTQTAAGYDRGSGWSTLAARHGFALLFPEQVQANNPNSCFNWFEAADTRRDGGEAASVVNAVAAMVAAHDLDPSRVFVTGLSAGGAMAAALLAAHPDVFAGGAVIAGLPAGIAHGIPEALRAMNAPANHAPRLLGDKVRGASSFTGPWPLVSVWHGDDDRTVAPANGVALAAQWANVHGIAGEPIERSDGRATTTTWHNAAGVAVVEFVRVSGMGHGTPIERGDGSMPAAFMLDVGIGSSARIAAFWGIASPDAARAHATKPAAAAARASRPKPAVPTPEPGGTRFDPGRLIADTLRSVGLMK